MEDEREEKDKLHLTRDGGGNNYNRNRNRNGGSGRNSKKAKEKKGVPRRGMGVERLEKYREEEVKNGNVAVIPSQTLPPFSPHPSLDPNISDGSVYGQAEKDPYLSLGHHIIGAAQPNNDAVPGIGRPPAFLPMEIPGSKGRTERSAQNANPPDDAFTWQHGNQLNSLHYSTMLNTQTEPPSNQNPYGTYRSVQTDGPEKVVHGKRPCSPSQDSNPSYHCKIHPFAPYSLERSRSFDKQRPSATNGSIGPREGLQGSMSLPNLHNRKDTSTDCMNSDAYFLHLGLPATLSVFPSSEPTQALPFVYTNQAEPPVVGSVPSQVPEQVVSNISPHLQQQRGFGFVPGANGMSHGQLVAVSGHKNNGAGEETEQDDVDLSLRL